MGLNKFVMVGYSSSILATVLVGRVREMSRGTDSSPSEVSMIMEYIEGLSCISKVKGGMERRCLFFHSFSVLITGGTGDVEIGSVIRTHPTVSPGVLVHD